MIVNNADLMFKILELKRNKPIAADGSKEMKNWHQELESNVSMLCEATTGLTLGMPKHIFTFMERKDYIEIEFDKITLKITKQENITGV